MVLLLLALVLGQVPSTNDPDRLYADRLHIDSATRAVEIWEARLSGNPNDFESAWKLARACYWIGGHIPANLARKQYERGIAAGQQAVNMQTGRPEGHFWIAANMGALAESYGLRQGIKYRGAIKDELETVLKLDPAFQQGSADRALGRWYAKVPRLFGGSRDQAIAHLQRSLMFNPDSTATHYFLAEIYVDANRDADARAEIQKVLDAPLDPEWTPEDLEFKQKARALKVS
jgi:tetratricopeptide (TPR) repeat protein